jgi:hypothetical protein
MATRKNLKKTGKKRIKPKGGAKKRKTVRGGVNIISNMSDFANSLLRRTHTNRHTPLVEEMPPLVEEMPQSIPSPHNWYYDLRDIESHLSEGEELNENSKYKYYIELFKNNNKFRKEILKYICDFNKKSFIIAIYFLYKNKLITVNLIKTLITNYNLKNNHDKLTLDYVFELDAFRTLEGQ